MEPRMPNTSRLPGTQAARQPGCTTRSRRSGASPQRAKRIETATASPCRGPVPTVSPETAAPRPSAAGPESPDGTGNQGRQGVPAKAALPFS